MTNNSCQLSKIKILIAQCQLLDFFSNVDTSGRKLTAQKVTFWTKSKQKYLSMTLTEISFFFWKQQIWLISILFQTNRNYICSLVCKRKYVEQNSMFLFSQLTFLRIIHIHSSEIRSLFLMKWPNGPGHSLEESVKGRTENDPSRNMIHPKKGKCSIQF